MSVNADKILYVASRLKREGDGIDFIEYLEDLSKRNYKAWKVCPPEMNEFHKGQATILDKLLDLFAECDNTLKKIDELKEKTIPDNT